MTTLMLLANLLFPQVLQSVTHTYGTLKIYDTDRQHYSSIKFDTKSIISDTLCEGEVGEFKYTFINVGNSPFQISNVKSSCGCYTPKWPRNPIQPGDSSEIIGRYTSQGRPGPFRRTMTVNFKDDRIPRTMLHVKGYTQPRALCKN